MQRFQAAATVTAKLLLPLYDKPLNTPQFSRIAGSDISPYILLKAEGFIPAGLPNLGIDNWDMWYGDGKKSLPTGGRIDYRSIYRRKP